MDGYDIPETELMPKFDNPFSYILGKSFIMLTQNCNGMSGEVAGGVCICENDYNAKYGV